MSVNLQSFDLKRLTVSLWKDLGSVENKVLLKGRTGSILEIGFALSFL